MKTFKQYIKEEKEVWVKRGKNAADKTVAMSRLPNGNYLVYVAAHNYVRGNIHKTLRVAMPKARMSHQEFQKYAREGMPKEDAEKFYQKKIKGKK